MTRVILGAFLVAHGLVHLLYVTPGPKDDPAHPFVPGSRWIVRAVGIAPGTAKAVAGAMAVLSAVLFAVAGIAALADASMWQPTAVVASVCSLVLMLLFFHPWLLIGIAIDVAIIADVAWLHVPASLFAG